MKTGKPTPFHRRTSPLVRTELDYFNFGFSSFSAVPSSGAVEIPALDLTALLGNTNLNAISPLIQSQTIRIRKEHPDYDPSNLMIVYKVAHLTPITLWDNTNKIRLGRNNLHLLQIQKKKALKNLRDLDNEIQKLHGTPKTTEAALSALITKGKNSPPASRAARLVKLYKKRIFTKQQVNIVVSDISWVSRNLRWAEVFQGVGRGRTIEEIFQGQFANPETREADLEKFLKSYSFHRILNAITHRNTEYLKPRLETSDDEVYETGAVTVISPLEDLLFFWRLLPLDFRTPEKFKFRQSCIEDYDSFLKNIQIKSRYNSTPW